jgi:hypothetical protein
VLGNASVRHSWTAPTSGTVRFDSLTRQTSFDTVLAVYAPRELVDQGLMRIHVLDLSQQITDHVQPRVQAPR